MKSSYCAASTADWFHFRCAPHMGSEEFQPKAAAQGERSSSWRSLGQASAGPPAGDPDEAPAAIPQQAPATSRNGHHAFLCGPCCSIPRKTRLGTALPRLEFLRGARSVELDLPASQTRTI
jgi:hypothetical protein